MLGRSVRYRLGSDDIALGARIYEIHRRSREAYGPPMIHAELVDDYGIRLNERTVIIRGLQEGRKMALPCK
jgi:hypothetical protein